jgi:RND family efflux transporter MFP subunit
MMRTSMPIRSLAHSSGTRALLAVALLGAAACSGESSAGTTDSAAANAPVVLGTQDVATARVSELGGGLVLSGPLEPKEQVTLRAQVAGTVADLRVDRGSSVRRGQRLATIRAAGVQSQAAGARASVAAAQANLAVARQRRDAARKLSEAGAMSEIDYRTAIATAEAAEAQLAAARAQSASAGEAAGYTTVQAPIDGTVSDRMVEEGEAVNPGGELLTIVNARVLELEGQIGVADAGRVRVGQPVVFTLDAYPGEEFRGRVARMDPTANPGTRQVGVYVELANATGRIIGGQFARGRVGVSASSSLVIPETAVQRAAADSSAGFVFVIVNNQVARRPVTIGARDEATGMVAVLNGLQAGEQVIATPTTDIKDGTRVTIASDAPAAAGAKE